MVNHILEHTMKQEKQHKTCESQDYIGKKLKFDLKIGTQ